MAVNYTDKYIVDKVYSNLYELNNTKSAFQTIQIFQSKEPSIGKILVLDGDMQLTESDEFIYHEMLTHVPVMSILELVSESKKQIPLNVLVIGGGDGGICRELLKYNDKYINSVTQVEIDNMVIELCHKYLKISDGIYNDSRLELIIDDANKWIITRKNADQKYDLIIMDTTDSTISNPLMTDEFLANIKKIMSRKSFLVLNADNLKWNHDAVKDILVQHSNFFKYSKVYQSYLPMYGDGHFGYVISSNYIDPINVPVRSSFLPLIFTSNFVADSSSLEIFSTKP